MTAYQIVQELRPRWMIRNRGERSFVEDAADFARVVVDGLPPREFNHLHEIPRETIDQYNRFVVEYNAFAQDFRDTISQLKRVARTEIEPPIVRFAKELSVVG